MQKLSYRFEQSAARLVVEGFPDRSAGQADDCIGILSAWRLQLVGAPELEGTREHLEALMAVVMPYARHCLSKSPKAFGGKGSFVAIRPDDNRHQLVLRSSREGVEPLQLQLDDADLADLVRCLDRLRLDRRVQLNWTLPEERPLQRRELAERTPLHRRLASPSARWSGSCPLGCCGACSAPATCSGAGHSGATLGISEPVKRVHRILIHRHDPVPCDALQLVGSEAPRCPHRRVS